MTSPKDFNLVASSGEFRPIDAILQLPFNIRNHSPYVCRKCKGNLKSYIQAKEKFHKIEEQLRETYRKCGFVECADSHEKPEPKMECKEIQTNLSFALEPESSRCDTVAYVHVCWPYGDRSRRLPPDLTQIAIYLLRTQNKNIAKMVLKHPLIRPHILKFIEKEISRECQEMCREYVKVEANTDDCTGHENKPKSRRGLFASASVPEKRKFADDHNKGCQSKKFVKKDIRSIFKRTSKEDLMSFTFEKASEEMKERCSLFWSILMAASTPHNSQDKLNGDVYQCVSVVTAASICLNNRSMRMTVVQLIISLIINHSSYTVSWFFTF